MFSTVAWLFVEQAPLPPTAHITLEHHRWHLLCAGPNTTGRVQSGFFSTISTIVEEVKEMMLEHNTSGRAHWGNIAGVIRGDDVEIEPSPFG
jgi:hypothetical protein